MSDNRNLVINLTANPMDDASTVAFTVANAALGKGMEVGVFLAADGVENSRSGASEFTHFPPFKRLADLIQAFTDNGGVLWSCSPCFNHRGLQTDETVDGTVVTGAGPMLDWIAAGATTLSY